MHAMVLEKTGPIGSAPLIYREVPTPEPGPGEVRIRVRCCAICRTDLHVVEGELPQHKLPLIPGHQIVGTVDKLGEGCTRVPLGRRVGVAWLRHTCGECEYCREGRENLCERSRYTGYDADGGYAEYAVVPEDFAYALPEAFDDPHAAPLLCGGVIGYRALRRCNPPSAGVIAMYGFGSSAHIVFQIARRRGLDVYVITRGKARQQLAREMGAAWVGGSTEGVPRKADSAIVFAPAGSLVPVALEALRKGGTLALAGIYMTDIPALEYERHVFYERDIHSVTANTREDATALLAEAADAGVRPAITTYALQDANKALQDLKSGAIDGSGVLMAGA